MAYKWNENLVEDNYCKYECEDCGKAFIVGEELAKGCTITCPYCKSEEVECLSCMDEQCVEDIGGLSCTGIYIKCGPDECNCTEKDCEECTQEFSSNI